MTDCTGLIEQRMGAQLRKYRQGGLLVFCPHTTAGVAVNENADPTVQRDFLHHFAKLVPWEDGFTHSERNADSHIQSIMVGPSVMVPIASGRLCLGTWQGIYFCEFDGPRTRSLFCQFLAGPPNIYGCEEE